MNIDRKLDIIYELLDNYCINGDFESCDKYIESVDIGKISITELLGILTITFIWRNKLSKRDKFYNDVSEYVYQHFSNDESDSIMIGLK